MTVKHSKVSLIADDTSASDAGQVLPSDWNADHVVSISASEILGMTGILSTIGTLSNMRSSLAGGSAGKVLKKNSNTDYDWVWSDDLAGGGGSADVVSSKVNSISNAVSVVSQAVSVETAARISADNALSNAVSVVSAAVATNSAQMTSADAALSNRISVLSAAVSTNSAQMTSADNALSNAISVLSAALSNRASAISAQVATNSAQMASADNAISNAVSVLSSIVSNLAANVAAISNTISARSYDISALENTVSVLSNMRSTLAGGSAGKVLKKVTNTDYDWTWTTDNAAGTSADVTSAKINSVSNAVSVVSAQVVTNSAQMTSADNAISNAVSVLGVAHNALSNQVSALSGAVATNSAQMTSADNAISNAVSVVSAAVVSTNNRISAISAAVGTNSAQMTSADNAISNAVSVVSVAVANVVSNVAVLSNTVSVLSNMRSTLAGGSAGKVLKKVTNTDYDWTWTTDNAGGAGSADVTSDKISVLSQGISVLSQQVSVISAELVSSKARIAILSGAQTCTGTAMTNVSGLSFSLAANATYGFKFVISWSSGTTVNGPAFGVTVPGFTSFIGTVGLNTGAAGTANLFSGSLNASDDRVVGVSAQNNTSAFGAIVEGVVKVSNAAGTLQLRAGSETSGAGGAGTSQIVVNAGTYGLVWRTA